MIPTGRLADAMYRVVLRLFPPALRERRGQDMARHFGRQREALRGHPILLATLWGRAVVDALQHGLWPRLSIGRTRLSHHNGTSLKDVVMRDLIDAVRMLRASPRTTFAVWLVMTVTLTAATFVFTVVDHVAIRPLPYPDPGSLIAVQRVQGTAAPGVVAPQDYFAWVDRADSLVSIGAVGGWSPLRLKTDAGTVPLTTQRATHTLFATMGVLPALGTGFEAVHEVTGNDGVVILSDKAWRQHFSADPSALGRALQFGTQSRRVIGVMPPGFAAPLGLAGEPDLWIPYVFRPNDRDHASGGRSFGLAVVGRLKPGTTVTHARSQIEAITADVRERFPADRTWHNAQVHVSSLHDASVGPAKGWLLLALAAVGVVLLLASANVANLMLAQATSRTRELAVRAAIGASAARLGRVALIESLLVAIAAAAAGLALTYLGLEAAVAVLPADMFRTSVIAMDTRVFVTAVVCASCAGIIAGLVPARQAARADVMSLLRSTGLPPRSRVRSALVVSQLAFVVVLVFATAVFVMSFVRVTAIDLGFDHADRVVWSIDALRPVQPPGTPPQNASAAGRVHDAALLASVQELPGVASAALIDMGDPFGIGRVSYSITPMGREEAEAPSLDTHSVTPDYVDAAGLRLIEGRFLTDQDVPGAPAVAVVSAEAARELFPDGSAVGRSVMFRKPLLIVGVVAGVRPNGPESEPRKALYSALAQSDEQSGMSLMVRSRGPVATLVPSVQAVLGPFVRAGQTPPVPRLLTERFREATAGRRVISRVMTGFGSLALFIGMFGVYGVLASLVAQQTREFGVRLALGATRSSILSGVLRHTIVLVSGGLALGLSAAWLATGTLSTLVVGIEPTEPALFAVVILIVTATALAAALIPAARAARVDPVIALRAE